MLQLIEKSGDEGVWVEAWFDLPNGNCVVERFSVTEEATYAQINTALEHFGKEAMDATLNTVQMSHEFAERYLYPAVILHHKQTRWN